MICKSCGLPVPDTSLVCVPCTMRKSSAALLDYQQKFLPHVAKGELFMTAPIIERVTHIQMFGAQKTWCGLDVKSGYRLKRLTLGELCAMHICQRCEQPLRAAIAETPSAA